MNKKTVIRAEVDRTAIERWEAEGGRTRPPKEHLARFHTVLVPIDLTPHSDRLLGRLARLPLAADAQVTILHVVPGSLPPSEQRAAERDARKALASEARHLRESLPRRIRIHPLVVLGSAAKEIAACAKQVKADLIVMGRGGTRALRDAFLGSTAERVIRRAQLPVLVVRLPARATYSRPALALDLDQAVHEIVRVMLLMLPSPRPRVEVIHAYHIPYRGLIYPSLSKDHTDETKEDLQHQAVQKLARLLAAALAKLGIRPADAPSWRTQVGHGSPRVVVEKATRRAETDLLVLGTRGYSGAAYAFLGTVSGDLLREAKCDVLVVPPRK